MLRKKKKQPTKKKTTDDLRQNDQGSRIIYMCDSIGVYGNLFPLENISARRYNLQGENTVRLWGGLKRKGERKIQMKKWANVLLEKGGHWLRTKSCS